MRVALCAGLVAVAATVTACNECTGTMSCRVDPEISYSGQMIDRETRRGVGGIELVFVRDSGVRLSVDSVKTVSNPEGHFTLRAAATRDGTSHGHLFVSAAAPFAPFVVPGISLATTRTRGDGGFIGRIVTKPFFRLVGFVRDRDTDEPVEGVRILFRRNAGGRLTRDSIRFVTGSGGVFSWLPEVTSIGAIAATFELSASGYPRTFVINRTLEMQYFDNGLSIQHLPLGLGFPQFAVTGRRGSGTPLPGTKVQLTRISGIQIEPQQVTVTPTDFGAFGFPIEPQAPGTVFVEVRITPPPPMAPEARTIALPTDDDDVAKSLGFMGVGAHVYFGAELRDASGALIPEETTVRIRRVAGLELLLQPTFPDGDHRSVGSNGRFEYGTPTADSGTVTFDLTIQHEAPFVWDTLRGITVQARYNDSLINLGTLTVPRRRQP